MAGPAPQLQITVNGEPRHIAASTTVAELLCALQLQDRPVAVERNRVLVRKAEFATTQLAEGDRLEVVTLFGGG